MQETTYGRVQLVVLYDHQCSRARECVNISSEDCVWYVCDMLYAVLYVHVNCFTVRECAVSWRYINVCNCDMFSVVMCTMTI